MNANTEGSFIVAKRHGSRYCHFSRTIWCDENAARSEAIKLARADGAKWVVLRAVAAYRGGVMEVKP